MMRYDFKKEFAKKHSQNFRSRRFKGCKPDIVVHGGNYENYQALKSNDVIRLIQAKDPQTEMQILASEFGCSNVHCADFHIESWIVSDDRGDDYDPYGVDREFYFLIAVEK